MKWKTRPRASITKNDVNVDNNIYHALEESRSQEIFAKTDFDSECVQPSRKTGMERQSNVYYAGENKKQVEKEVKQKSRRWRGNDETKKNIEQNAFKVEHSNKNTYNLVFRRFGFCLWSQ